MKTMAWQYLSQTISGRCTRYSERDILIGEGQVSISYNLGDLYLMLRGMDDRADNILVHGLIGKTPVIDGKQAGMKLPVDEKGKLRWWPDENPRAWCLIDAKDLLEVCLYTSGDYNRQEFTCVSIGRGKIAGTDGHCLIATDVKAWCGGDEELLINASEIAWVIRTMQWKGDVNITLTERGAWLWKEDERLAYIRATDGRYPNFSKLWINPTKRLKVTVEDIGVKFKDGDCLRPDGRVTRNKEAVASDVHWVEGMEGFGVCPAYLERIAKFNGRTFEMGVIDADSPMQVDVANKRIIVMPMAV